MQLTPYHAKYFSYDLLRRRSANDIGKLTASLQDAQVDLNPHQIDAALFAFKSPLSKGALLADEVGLGKTIEAGIILSQQQWSQELADKFFLPSLILENKSFNEETKKGNLNPFDTNKNIIICSLWYNNFNKRMIFEEKTKTQPISKEQVWALTRSASQWLKRA